MIPAFETLLHSMPGAIGKELLAELWSAPWGTPMYKNVEGAGFALGTATGAQRSRNEDRIAVAHVTSISREQYAVAVVCDGVGGSEMGDLAATLVVATLVSGLAQSRARVMLPSLLTELVRRADDTVRSVLDGRGTTTVSVVLGSSSGQIAATNVGDSRIYAWAPGAVRLSQVSVDDTMENELRNLPLKDDSVLAAHGLRGRLSQAIGEAGRSSNDLKIVVFGKDQFPNGALLATDGAWKADLAGFEGIASHAASPSDAVRRVLAFSAWTGGLDNVSVIAVEDLLKFAKHSVDSVRVSLPSAWATVWIGDAKFVACDSTPEPSKIGQQFQPREAQSKQSPDARRTKRKAQTRRKDNPALAQVVEPQLDLRTDGHGHDQPIGGRPKVEVSTDDDDTSNT